MIHDYEGKDKEGMVLRYEKSSINDGDGMRTVVFLKGCPLCCRWCSTPESQHGYIEKTDSNVYGFKQTVEQVLKEVRKDIPFYFHSGGGMTLSGGEVLAQPEFTRLILKRACYEGISCAIETSFFQDWKYIEPILEYLSILFVDLKFYSTDLHKKYTGVDNSRILENMLRTNDVDLTDCKFVIRIPTIPGYNDTEFELRKMGQFLSQLKNLHHVQLLPYHKLGLHTYEELGREYQLQGTEVPSEEHMLWCAGIIREYVDHVMAGDTVLD